VTDEEKQQQEAESEATEEQVEETEADEDPVEEPVGPQSPEGEVETVAEGGAEPAEGDLGPKARRKLERSRASGPPAPARGTEQRARERAERRRRARSRRRQYRAATRRRRDEPRAGTPPAQREAGTKKVRQGTVVSAAADKTITVEIAVVRRHPTYEKVVRRTSRLRAHDQSNQAREGDVVRVIEARPLSHTKRWRLLDVVERAR
jgi:small subunit ribosomal protein S17